MGIFTAPNIGSCSMGVVMGVLVWFFVGKFKQYNSKVLASTASVLSGGAVIKAFGWNSAYSDASWYYPIGLLAATTLYWLVILASKDAAKFFAED
jgi:hypothetical protein